MIDGGRSAVARVLPDYDIEDELGRGQQGVVWRGHHRQLGRSVAVKQLAMVSAHDATRFRREARVLAQISHPHVVSVYDYREDGDLRVIVMELMGGGTLADRMRDGISPVSAVAAVLAAASGLAQVHEQGILHRDVKPENLMFDSHARLKVADFGLARDELADTALTNVSQAGGLFGTPAYIAPEQIGATLASGWPPVSPASDQYALAAVLYGALSGRTTHDGTGGALALCNRRLNDEAVRLAEVAPTIPEPIARVVMRSLRRDTNERYASCEDFGVDLALAAGQAWGPNWLSDSGIPLLSPGRILSAASGQPGPPLTNASADQKPPARPRPPRRRAMLAGAATPLMAVAAGAGFLVLRDHGDQSANSPAELDEVWSVATEGAVFSSPAVATADGDRLAVAGSRDGSVYAIDVATGDVVWEQATGDEVRSSPTVADGTVYVGSDDGYLYALALADGSVRWRESVGFQIVSSPVVADETVVVGADQLYAFDAASGEALWEYAADDVIASSPAISDGTVFVGSDDGSVYAVALVDGSEVWVHPTSGPVQSSPAVTGGTVYTGSTDGSLYALDAGTGEDRWVSDLGAAIKSSPTVEGKLVYVGTDGGRLVAVNATSGAEIWAMTAPDRLDSSPVVVGGKVAIGCNDGRVYVASATSGELEAVFATDGPVLSSPAAVGRSVVVGSNDGSIYLVELDLTLPSAAGAGTEDSRHRCRSRLRRPTLGR